MEIRRSITKLNRMEQWIKSDVNVYNSLLDINNKPSARIKELLSVYGNDLVRNNVSEQKEWAKYIRHYVLHKVGGPNRTYRYTIRNYLVDLLKPEELIEEETLDITDSDDED